MYKSMMDKVSAAWNEVADEYNQWDTLDEDEKITYAFVCGGGEDKDRERLDFYIEHGCEVCRAPHAKPALYYWVASDENPQRWVDIVDDNFRAALDVAIQRVKDGE